MPARGGGEQRGRRIRLQRRKSLWFPQRALFDFCAHCETDRDVLFSNTLFCLSSQRSPKYLPSFFPLAVGAGTQQAVPTGSTAPLFIRTKALPAADMNSCTWLQTQTWPDFSGFLSQTHFCRHGHADACRLQNPEWRPIVLGVYLERRRGLKRFCFQGGRFVHGAVLYPEWRCDTVKWIDICLWVWVGVQRDGLYLPCFRDEEELNVWAPSSGKNTHHTPPSLKMCDHLITDASG